MPIVGSWCESATCCDPEWEAAYRRFETPDEEIRKFRRRLLRLGAKEWPRDARILELCCGRGNGLRALTSLGFTSLMGVDLSAELMSEYDGPARLFVGDCRDLHLPSDSIDIVIVQGGLHHLQGLPNDLAMTLAEVRRVLHRSGRFVVVEPWLTPFLRMVHTICDAPRARRLSARVDALATMIECERSTYHAWLARKSEIAGLLRQHFSATLWVATFGKLLFVGRPLA